MWTVFDNLWDWESEVHQQVLKLITENLLHVYIIKMFLDSANQKNYMYWSMVEIKWPNLQGYSSRSSSHHYLFATCMFHCMIPKLIPHDGLQDTSMNKDCIEYIVTSFHREFDLPWEVDASKGPARSSRPGRSRWFSEDPSALLYSNIASIVFMVLLYAWVLQYSLYCIAVDVLFFSVQLPILRISSKFRITSVQAFKKFQWYMCKLMFWCCLYL